MDPAQMMQRAPPSPVSGTCWLEGGRITFGGEDLGGEGALSTVVEDPSSRVFVVLYDVSPLDVDQLDRWEGGELGMHKKLRLRIQTMDGPQLAWVYVLDAYEGGLPSARYIGVLSDAAEAAGAPDDYVQALRGRPRPRPAPAPCPPPPPRPRVLPTTTCRRCASAPAARWDPAPRPRAGPRA